MPEEEQSPYRLPRAVVPGRYDVTLTPDLAAATFTGDVKIALDVREATDTVVLNAAELDVTAAWVADGAGTSREAKVAYDMETERVTLTLEGAVASGAATLHAEFRGVLNDKLRGFYRSTFTGGDGVEHVVAATQMEATDARRVFPCFDEPDLKAVFGVTLVVPEGLAAVSNAAVVSEESTGDGRRRVRFADTIPMSTYLLAFVVGPLEATAAVDVDGVPVRVLHPPGKDHLCVYALEVAAFALRWFGAYYAIPYPGDKLDLVALPDFAAGAMENLGCVTFREALLLLDPATATQHEQAVVAEIVAHELAHMWFGDLVTMKWWNGIWLNEAFATFMEVAAVDAFRPAWDRWTHFGLERSAAFDVDALDSTRPIEYPVVSPDDADGMFDVLTYQKGASVLRMLEQFLGEDGFREGIRAYLDAHRFGNTETGDLWDAIEGVTGEPARRIMDSWIFQGGFPLVSVERHGGALRLTQRRFRYQDGGGQGLSGPLSGGQGLSGPLSGGQGLSGPLSGEHSPASWPVPLILRDGGGAEHRVLLEEETDEVVVDAPGPVVANAGGHGFYRVAYGPDLLEELTHVLGELAPVERYGLLDDTWAAVLAGATPAPEFLGLVRRCSTETYAGIWRLLAGCLGALDRIVEGDARQALAGIVRDTAGAAFGRLGWEPGGGEGDLVREARGVLVGLLGDVGADTEVRERARGLHDLYLADAAAVEPNVAAAVVGVVALTGDVGDYEVFLGRFHGASTPQEELRYLYALPVFPGRDLFERTLAMTLTDDVRTQNAPFVLGRAMGNRQQGLRAWEFVRDHWAEVNERFPPNTISRMLAGIRALSRPEVAADIGAFFAVHEVPQAGKMLDQHLEKLRVNVALREREASRLAAALTAPTL